jgi:hypothetical protein
MGSDGFKFWRWVIYTCIAAALVLGPYGAATKIRNTQLVACEAAKIDRGLQADSWRAAFRARSATAVAPDTGPHERRVALEAARVYAETASRLEARSDERYVCSDVYPRPSLLPF